MITVTVTACSAFGLTVFEAKTETMSLHTKDGGKAPFTITAAGQGYKPSNLCTWAGLLPQIESSGSRQRSVFRGLGGASSGTKWKSLTARGVRLRLKVRILKADAIETLLCGCVTWSANKPDYDKRRQVHHSMLLRCLGWRKRKRDDYTITYVNTLAKTDSARALRRQCGMSFTGFVAPKGEECPPRRVMFGELLRCKGYSGGQEKDWVVRLEKDMTA